MEFLVAQKYQKQSHLYFTLNEYCDNVCIPNVDLHSILVPGFEIRNIYFHSPFSLFKVKFKVFQLKKIYIFIAANQKKTEKRKIFDIG